MTSRRTHAAPNAADTRLAGMLLVLGVLGCTEVPTAPPDAARKDVATEAAGDATDAPSEDAPKDVALDAADASDATDASAPEEDGPQVVFEELEFLSEDAPPGYDIQLDRVGDALAPVAFSVLDASVYRGDAADSTARVPCVPGTNETCACTDGREGWQVCEDYGGFSVCECDTIPPPPAPLPARLVFPPTGSRVTSQRPSLRWAPPVEVVRARVELCADRPCARVLAQQEVADTVWRPATRLSPGVVFWRVHGLDARGTAVWTSPTWYFQVRARDSAVDTAYGRIRDFNGDGYDDLLVRLDMGATLYLGSPEGLSDQPSVSFALSPDGVEAPLVLGNESVDVTGDGLTDWVAMQGRLEDDRRILNIYAGDRRLPLGRRVARAPQCERWSSYPTVPVDHEGDGYLDVMVDTNVIVRGGPMGGCWSRGRDGIEVDAAADFNRDGLPEYSWRYSRAYWPYGRLPLPDLAHLPIALPDRGLGPNCAFTTAVGDFNGDQFDDVVGICDTIETRDFSAIGLMTIFGGPRVFRRDTRRVASSRRPGRVWKVGAQGDIDGDGYLDLVLAEREELYAYRGGPLGLSVTPRAISMDLQAEEISSLGDLNGDGCDETGVTSCGADSSFLNVFDGGPLWPARVTRLRLPYCARIR